MLQIQDTIVSLDVIEKKFCCDLAKCKGQCCVAGDSGAPLTDDEVYLIEEEYENYKPFLRPEGIEAIEEQGNWVIDAENDQVTPLINGKECAYTIIENGIYKCGIEKAYFEKKTSFRKPVSCHLYPVRLHKYSKFTAVNYDFWSVCQPAVNLGNEQNILAADFLKDALIRKFGSEWYEELRIARDYIKDKPAE
jgi:hypothetical protein